MFPSAFQYLSSLLSLHSPEQTSKSIMSNLKKRAKQMQKGGVKRGPPESKSLVNDLAENRRVKRPMVAIMREIEWTNRFNPHACVSDSCTARLGNAHLQAPGCGAVEDCEAAGEGSKSEQQVREQEEREEEESGGHRKRSRGGVCSLKPSFGWFRRKSVGPMGPDPQRRRWWVVATHHQAAPKRDDFFTGNWLREHK